MKYLIKETVYFVDGHGDAEEGGDLKFITEDKKFKNLDSEKYYSSSYMLSEDDEGVDEEDLMGAEDGYNSQYSQYIVVEITDEKALEYQDIIDKYNKI